MSSRVLYLIGLCALLGGATGAGAEAPAKAAPAATEAAKDEKALAELLSRVNEARKGEAAAPAAIAPSPAAASQPQAAASLWRILSYSALTAALLLGVAFGYRRWQNTQGGAISGNELELKEALWVGRGQRVLLLRVGQQHVLVGQSGGSFENLGAYEIETGGSVLSLSESEPEPELGPPRDKGAAEHFAALVQDELVDQASKSTPRRSRSRVLDRLNRI